MFLKEPVRPVYLLSLPLTLVGLFMIVGINWSHLDASYRVGVYYGLAAAVFYAAFILSLRKLQADQMGGSFFLCCCWFRLALLFFQRPTILVNWLGVLIALAAIYLGMARKSADADSTPGAGLINRR